MEFDRAQRILDGGGMLFVEVYSSSGYVYLYQHEREFYSEWPDGVYVIDFTGGWSEGVSAPICAKGSSYLIEEFLPSCTYTQLVAPTKENNEE